MSTRAQALDAAVRDGHSVAERGGLQLLALDHRPLEGVPVGDLAENGSPADQLPDRVVFFDALEVGHDGSLLETALNAHMSHERSMLPTGRGGVKEAQAMRENTYGQAGFLRISSAHRCERGRGPRRRQINGRGINVAKTQGNRQAKMPEKLTGSSLVGYLAEKNGLARKEVKQVVEDLFDAVAAGRHAGRAGRHRQDRARCSSGSARRAPRIPGETRRPARRSRSPQSPRPRFPGSPSARPSRRPR